MPDEQPRTSRSKELRALLDSATPKKPKVQIISHDTPTSLALKVNADSEADGDSKTANGKADVPKQGKTENENDGLPPWLLGPDSIEAVKYCRESTIALHYDILEFSRLFLPTSDIDMCVMGTPNDGSMEEMEKVASAVRNVEGFARKVNIIKARVSLVKLVAREGGVQCDISFGQSNGPKNVPIIRRYLQDYPALRPLLLVVKCFLQQRSLNEVYSGGLGSYGVLLL
eukprot:IDg20666t1